jgi:ElaB/YqjD/DUF883 family membrane-anchored ribosome-binding protein
MRFRTSGNGSMANVRHDLEALRHDVAKLAQEMPSMLSDARDESLQAARERVHRMKDSLDASLSKMSKTGREAAQVVSETTDSLVHDIEETFHAHPIATIAVAMGIGFALGRARSNGARIEHR